MLWSFLFFLGKHHQIVLMSALRIKPHDQLNTFMDSQRILRRI